MAPILSTCAVTGSRILIIMLPQRFIIKILQIPNQLLYSTNVTGFLSFKRIFDLDVMVQPRNQKIFLTSQLTKTVWVDLRGRKSFLCTRLYNNIKVENPFEGLTSYHWYNEAIDLESVVTAFTASNKATHSATVLERVTLCCAFDFQ